MLYWVVILQLLWQAEWQTFWYFRPTLLCLHAPFIINGIIFATVGYGQINTKVPWEDTTAEPLIKYNILFLLNETLFEEYSNSALFCSRYL